MSRPSSFDPSRRAVITGMGIVSALGIGKEAFWSGLQSGRSPIEPLTLFSTAGLKAGKAAWIKDWNPLQWIAPHRLKRMDRCTQFAVASAHMAIADAGLKLSPQAPNLRAGVSYGTALGGFAQGEYSHEGFMEKGRSALSPSLGLQIFPSSGQGNIAIEFGLQGQGTTNANTCAAGNVAMGDALRLIQHGGLDVVIAGAAEAPLSPMIFAAFDKLGTMSSAELDQPYRPYHRHRDGFVMGEGSAFFVVESLAHAEARQAKIYAEILGYASTTEAYHMSTPDTSGVALQAAMRLALKDSEQNVDEVDYVNTHASGTQANDINELNHLRTVFGHHAAKLAISGTKPFTGHTLGAAGAIEFATCLLALENQWVPPTLGLDEPDPDCQGMDIIALQGREKPLRRVMTNSFGFGGIDTSLILGKL